MPTPSTCSTWTALEGCGPPPRGGSASTRKGASPTLRGSWASARATSTRSARTSGRRLRRFGKSILLDPTIQGTHLKAWTLKGTLAADFQHRGVPWMWLLIVEGPAETQALNVRRIEKVLTAMATFGLAMPVAALLLHSWWPVAVTGVIAGRVLVRPSHSPWWKVGRVRDAHAYVSMAAFRTTTTRRPATLPSGVFR